MPRRLPLCAISLLLSPAAPARAQFTDVSATSGIQGGLPTWGAVLVDIDGDGDVDVMNHHHFFSNAIFKNDGAGNFSVSGIPLVSGFQDRHAFTFVDLDGDRLLDVLCSHGGNGGCGCIDDGNELLQGVGGGSYQAVTDAGGMADSTGRGRSFSGADVDGDGDVDLYHAKAPLAASPNSLYRNDGGMTFTDVAPQAGLDEVSGTVAGLFEDYDDDGDPDLLVGGEEFGRPTKLFRNDGGVFVDVTAAVFGALPVVAGADWGDFDNDGDMDLAIVEGHEGIWDAWHDGGSESWLFSHFRFSDDGVDAYWFDTPGEDPTVELRFNGQIHNNMMFLGSGAVNPAPSAFQVTLTDSLVGAPAFTPGVSTGLYCWRDSVGGTWQVRVSAPPGTFGNFTMRVLTANITAPGDSSLEQISLTPAVPRLFRNDGGTFQEVTSALGITTTSVNPRSVTWVDFDLDGDLDLHQTNRGTTETLGEDDLLWRNDGALFTALGGAGWVPGNPGFFTDGGVWGDLDGDGDPDLILQEGAGPVFFSAVAPTLYYRNDGPNGNWLKVTPYESSSGATPVGGKLTCYVQGAAVHRRVSADSWEGFQGPRSVTFGLGSASTFDSLVVVWPDGERRVIPGGMDPTDAGVLLESGSAAFSGEGFAGAVFPQPALGRQRLAVDVPGAGRLRVTVHDVAGRRVRLLEDGARAAPGRRLLTWDGRDDRGARVTPGVYFLRGEGDLRFVRKSVRLR